MSDTKNNFFWKMQRGEIPPPNIANTLQLQFLDIDTDNQTLKTQFTIGEEFTNPAGNVQGGIIAAMLDDTMGPALAAVMEPGKFAPTLNLNISFIKGGNPGDFFGIGKVVKKGRSICYLSGELFDVKQNLIATATATAKVNNL